MTILAADVLSKLVELVFDLAFKYTKLDEKIRSWLGRDPAKLAFKKCLINAYSEFTRQFPDLTASLLDSSFFLNEGAPELAKLLTLHQRPDPEQLAKKWMSSFGGNQNVPEYAVKALSQFFEWLDAELKAEPIFQPLFDSQNLESLPRLEQRLEELTREITRSLNIALESARRYSVVIEGSQNVVGNFNTVTVHNSYYLGDFTTINEYYLQPTAIFERVRLKEFTGRKWLETKVDNFLASHTSGVFLLVGEAGVGKTTFLAHLVDQRRYIHIFGEQVRGKELLPRALQSLGAQLVARYQLEGYSEKKTLPQIAIYEDFLDRLIRQAAEKLCANEKLVIVCDAIDEVGIAANGNPVGLPSVIPENVYFILSQRPVSVPLNIDTENCHREDLTKEKNTEDIREYLEQVAQRSTISSKLVANNYSQTDFVDLLAAKSEGVWIYLHYVIPEIEKNTKHHLSLENLPVGLARYYATYWCDWKEGRQGGGRTEWNTTYAPLLALLAASQEPLTLEQITQWGKIDENLARQLLTEDWRPYITIYEADSKRGEYQLYHTSFKDFITGKIDRKVLTPAQENLVNQLKEHVAKAHDRIVDFFQNQSEGDWVIMVNQDYPRNHLTYHLANAGRFEELVNLIIFSDRWAKARFQQEGHYLGYLNDADIVRQYTFQERKIDLLIRTLLCISSIRSLSASIPNALIIECVKKKVISPSLGESLIKQKNDGREKVEGFVGLLDFLPVADKEKIIKESYYLAKNIRDESYRSHALSALAPHLPPELLAQAMQAAQGIGREIPRTEALHALAPYLPPELQAQALQDWQEFGLEYLKVSFFGERASRLPPELLAQALQDAQGIGYEFARAEALSVLASHLPDGERAEVLAQALQAAQGIWKNSYRIDTFSVLAPLLPPELLAQALQAAQEIRDEDYRAWALIALASHLPDGERAKVLAQALQAAQRIGDEGYRAWALSALAPHLPDDERAEVLSQALQAAQEIRVETIRARALSALTSHLPVELLSQALQAALGIGDEDSRAEALSALAPQLPLKLQLEVFTKKFHQAENLDEIASIFTNLYDENKSICFHEFLFELGNKPIMLRQTLIEILQGFSASIKDLEGEKLCQEIAMAIVDTGKWWP